MAVLKLHVGSPNVTKGKVLHVTATKDMHVLAIRVQLGNSTFGESVLEHYTMQIFKTLDTGTKSTDPYSSETLDKL